MTPHGKGFFGAYLFKKKEERKSETKKNRLRFPFMSQHGFTQRNHCFCHTRTLIQEFGWLHLLLSLKCMVCLLRETAEKKEKKKNYEYTGLAEFKLTHQVMRRNKADHYMVLSPNISKWVMNNLRMSNKKTTNWDSTSLEIIMSGKTVDNRCHLMLSLSLCEGFVILQLLHVHLAKRQQPFGRSGDIWRTPMFQL